MPYPLELDGIWTILTENKVEVMPRICQGWVTKGDTASTLLSGITALEACTHRVSSLAALNHGAERKPQLAHVKMRLRENRK